MRTVFLYLVALFMPYEGFACQCDIGTIDERFQDAIAAFHIRVTATELRATSELDFASVASAEFLEDIPDYVRVFFEVIEVFKGNQVFRHT